MLLKSTSGTHESVINGASDVISHLTANYIPDAFSLFVIATMETLMKVGDMFGTRILELYFDLIEYIFTLC